MNKGYHNQTKVEYMEFSQSIFYERMGYFTTILGQK